MTIEEFLKRVRGSQPNALGIYSLTRSLVLAEQLQKKYPGGEILYDLAARQCLYLHNNKLWGIRGRHPNKNRTLLPIGDRCITEGDEFLQVSRTYVETHNVRAIKVAKPEEKVKEHARFKKRAAELKRDWAHEHNGHTQKPIIKAY